MIEKRILMCGVLLFGVIFLLGINLPPYEEIYSDDVMVEEQQEEEQQDYEPHITIHREKIEDYSFPRNSWIGMEVADIEYTSLMSDDNANRDVLTASKGVHNGVSGIETWYNLPMDGVIQSMRNLGYSEAEYPYWIREDGVKMFGAYVMCAANLEIRPKGTILETSLGKAIVCDTGGFAAHNQTQVDIATNWGN